MSSEIKANSIQDKTGARVLASDSGSAWSWGSGVPAGTILQVQGTQINATNISETGSFGSTGSGVEKAISGFEVNISPKQTGSSFHIMITVSLSAVSGDSAEAMIILKRGYDSSGGSTFSYTDLKADLAGSATRTTFTYDFDWTYGNNRVVTRSSSVWDSTPSYVAGGKFKYAVYWLNRHNTAADLYLNRAINTANENATATSSIVVYEIAGT